MRVLWSIGLLSAAIIAFQLALMQVLSIVQWYHFAYMVISVALLGFGTAGTVLSIFRKKMLAHLTAWLFWLMMGAGLGMALVTGIAQTPAIRFDAYLLFTDLKQAGLLLLNYLLFFIPFFLGALAIGLLFVAYAERISKLYFANLTGSGMGGILALVGVGILSPQQLTTVMAILPVLAAWLILPRRYLIVLAAIVIIGLKWMFPSPLHLSQYKDLSKTLLLPGAKITREKNSPGGLIQTLTSPALRYAPGLSLNATTTGDVNYAAFVNGDWFGAVLKADTSCILNYTTLALPYVIGPRKEVLVLSAGGGAHIQQARSNGAEKITAVEPNAVMLNILQNDWGPGVRALALEPRTFLSTGTEEFDLITLPIAGSFGGARRPLCLAGTVCTDQGSLP